MGYYKDLGSSIAKDLDPTTGFPRDQYQHLLDPSEYLVEMSSRGVGANYLIGKELHNLTSPYGHLHFAVGSGDDFHCFDYATINAGVHGEFIVLHSVLNCETGGFIQDAVYEVVPVNNLIQKQFAISIATEMVHEALDWSHDGDGHIRMTMKGWNQRPEYFIRSVARALVPYAFDDQSITDRQMRWGGKRVQSIFNNVTADPHLANILRSA